MCFCRSPSLSAQTGDPLGPDSKESTGGSSIWGLLTSTSTNDFEPEFDKKRKHQELGTVSMATTTNKNRNEIRTATSQFTITLDNNLDYLDGKGAIFGKVVEGFDVLEKINSAFVDNRGRPLRDIRIRHTVVLDDPYTDPPGFPEAPESPLPSATQLATVRIADDEDLDDNLDEEDLEKLRRERDARAQALTLEMVGDLPFAEVKPPENVLFVCKLNPVTQDDDLELIFGRFGKILSCEVIRDKKTGDSLQYAFIEFEQKENCEQAFFKMQDVLIDDHRIHVDFSQSVSRLSDSWRNATNVKRQNQANFGGISGLERKRQYRNVHERDAKNYNFVLDNEAPDFERSSHFNSSKTDQSLRREEQRRRSRSPRSETRVGSKARGYERRERHGHDDHDDNKYRKYGNHSYDRKSHQGRYER